MRFSISHVLVIGFLGVIWGTYLITTTTSHLTSKQAMEENARGIMDLVADYAMEKSQNYLSRAQRATELTERLLRSHVLESGDQVALENYFIDQLLIYPDISGLYFGAPNGDFFFVSRSNELIENGFRTKVISHAWGKRAVTLRHRDTGRILLRETKDVDDDYDPRARPWYLGAKAKKGVFWTDPYVFYTSQKPGITISGPNYRNNGKLRGIVGVDIELDQLSTFISGMKIGQNGRAILINRNCEVVAFHDKSKLSVMGADNQYRLIKVQELDDALSRKSFEGIADLQKSDGVLELASPLQHKFQHDGHTYLASFTPFPDPQWPWVIGMYLPEDDYLGPIKRNLWLNNIIALCISVIASFFALKLANSISGPIVDLRQFADAIRTHDYKRPLSLFTHYQEIRETADRFEQLKQKLGEETHDRQEAQHNLRVKEREYASLVENLNVGVYRTTVDGKLINANSAFARLYGYDSVDEMRDMNMAEFYSSSALRQELLALLQRDGSVQDWESRMHHKDENRFVWVAISCAFKYNDHGQPQYVEGVIEDITQKKQNDELLITSERMAAVGILAGGVAHEFNNIHTGVLGYAELGIRDKHNTSTLKSYFEMIKMASLRAKGLTANLLSFSSRRQSDAKPTDLVKVVTDSLALVRKEFITEGIKVETHFGEVPDPVIDGAQIGQVVLNFLINARHALIEREERKITITIGREAKQVFVAVRDTGCGISDKNMKDVFTPFFSTKGEYAAQGSPQAVVKGTGLGLSVCHTIAKNHGGDISIDSEVDVGTTIRLVLPVGDTDGVRAMKPKLVQKVEEGRIVVLDDEVQVRDIVRKVLMDEGLYVRASDDGAQVLAWVLAGEVDLVLVDLQMPKMNGVEFIKALPPVGDQRRPVPIIVTGRLTDDASQNYDDLNVADTITKPFEVDELINAVRKNLMKKFALNG